MPDDGSALVGHNNPPVVDPEILSPLKEEAKKFADAAKYWGNEGISDDDDAAKVNDLLGEVRKFRKRVDGARRDAKKPFDDGAKAVQAAFVVPLIDPIDRMVKAIDSLLRNFTIEKQRKLDEERRRQEEIARKEREAAERAAEAARIEGDVMGEAEAEARAKEADEAREEAARETKARVASSTGTTKAYSVRKSRSARITDARRLAIHYIRNGNPRLMECLQALANADVRAKDVDESQIPGIAVIEE